MHGQGARAQVVLPPHNIQQQRQLCVALCKGAGPLLHGPVGHLCHCLWRQLAQETCDVAAAAACCAAWWEPGFDPGLEADNVLELEDGVQQHLSATRAAGAYRGVKGAWAGLLVHTGNC